MNNAFTVYLRLVRIPVSFFLKAWAKFFHGYAERPKKRRHQYGSNIHPSILRYIYNYISLIHIIIFTDPLNQPANTQISLF